MSNPQVHTDAHGQKYLRLDVPDYDRSGASTHQPHTYLQLGAHPTQGSSKDRGDDLLDLVGLTKGCTHYFKDDYRHKNKQTKPGTEYWRDDGTKPKERDPVELTSELRTRGGWRLHTDGNYVSTTRGDRVDVIGGNYKLVVLGRTDIAGDDFGESYWESSGGHSFDGTNFPGARVSISWNKTDECWHVVDETVKGDCIERYQGIVEEIYEGPKIESFIGSKAGKGVIPTSASSDPHTQTDEDSGWINPGSGPGTGWPRQQQNPDVTETIKAKKITEDTEADTITVTSTLGSKTEKNFAWGGALSDAIESEGANVTITKKVGTEANAIGDYKDLKFALGLVSSDIYATYQKTSKGGWSINIDVIPLQIELELIGAKQEVAYGRLDINVNYSASFEISLAAELAINTGIQMALKLVTVLDAKLLPLDIDLFEMRADALDKATDAIKSKVIGVEMHTYANHEST